MGWVHHLSHTPPKDNVIFQRNLLSRNMQ